MVVLLSSRGGTRTPDPVINSHLLYQLSYSGLSTSGCAFSCAHPLSTGQNVAARRRLSNVESAPHRVEARIPGNSRICGSQRSPDAPSPGSCEAPMTLSRSRWDPASQGACRYADFCLSWARSFRLPAPLSLLRRCVSQTYGRGLRGAVALLRSRVGGE